MVFYLLSPLNLSFWWNFGSLLIILIALQILSGIFLAFYYTCEIFYSNFSMHLEVFNGEIVQLVHANFPNIIFFFLYIHIFKGILFNSFSKIKETWLTGWLILIIVMATAFLGYVLPWGQISLWGATVIINLLRILPRGRLIVMWIWGGYFVSGFTLKVFFTLHFLFPFILLLIISLHIVKLHLKGSSNPLGLDSSIIKIEFTPNFMYKDFLNFIIIFIAIAFINYFSFYLLDGENFIPANFIISPIHIQPEWYFLQFYAILRAIPNKLGGVVLFGLALILILILVFLDIHLNLIVFKIWRLLAYRFIVINSILIWLGRCVVEAPYILLSQVLTFRYFLWFFILFLFN